MTRLKFNVGSMNIFNTISKNIHCFRLKNGFKISNEIQYLGLQAPKCSRLQVLTKRSKRPNAMQNLAYEHKKTKINSIFNLNLKKVDKRNVITE